MNAVGTGEDVLLDLRGPGADLPEKQLQQHSLKQVQKLVAAATAVGPSDFQHLPQTSPSGSDAQAHTLSSVISIAAVALIGQ